MAVDMNKYFLKWFKANKADLVNGKVPTSQLPEMNFLPLTGGTITGSLTVNQNFEAKGTVRGSKVYGAVWNDYAETRLCNRYIEPGYVVCESNIDELVQPCNEDLCNHAMVVSDTYGFLIGPESTSDLFALPIATSGRVLVYCDTPITELKPGDALCSTSNGTVRKMSKEELIIFPLAVIGIFSCVPNANIWPDIKINNRIWMKIK